MIENQIKPSQLDFENNPPIIVGLLKSRNSELYSKVLEVYRKVKDILDTRVSQVFPNYTLHNMGHSLRIMNYMGHIVPELNDLSDLELAILIHSALLHDIGMGATSEELNQIKVSKLQYKNLKYDAFLKRFGDHTLALQDYVRRVHAIRSAYFIKNEISDLLIIPEMPNTSFGDEVADICQGHQEDITWILKNIDKYGQKGTYAYNGVFCAMVLRLSDLLDFDSERTPPKLYKVLDPQGISKEEWQQHFTIDNSNKIYVDTETRQKEIMLYGKCDNSNIHRKVLKYIDWINVEIESINAITKDMDVRYRINFIPKVNNNIKSEGYTFADLRFNVNFKQVTRLLMGEQIYGAKRFGLRELIQNSIDACKTRKEIEDSKTAYGYDEYEPTIKILLDKSKNIVTIVDNGTGMTIEILKKYFLNVGSSYYTSDDFQLQDLDHKPIGNYGIGFLACFMLSKKVVVKTRHFQSYFKYEVELLKEDEYVSIKEVEDVTGEGTEIILNYMEFMNVWKNNEYLSEVDSLDFFDNTEFKRIELFLNQYFISDGITIELIDVDNRNTVKIINKLINKNENDSYLHVNLSDFLNDIIGELYIKNPERELYSQGSDDIPSYGTAYSLIQGKLVEFESSNLDILDFVFRDEVKVLDIPLIENEEIFSKMLEVFNDNEKALERYIEKERPEYLSVLISDENVNSLNRGLISNTKDIMEGFPFELLCEHGQNYDCLTIVDYNKYRVFTQNGIPFYFLLGNIPNKPKDLIELYVRGVFVKFESLSNEFFIKLIRTAKFKVNITHTDVIPSISRDEFPSSLNKLIVNSIYSAICFKIYESIEDYQKKAMMLEYLKKYFKEPNFLLKDKYAALLV